MRRNSGFTLIELLVVITIIGILAGLSFPAITVALNAAKKAEANTMVNQLKIAMTSYQTEYGVWPNITGVNETGFDAGLLFDLLQGEAGVAENPRRIVFMEFNSKSLRVAPASSSNKVPADPATADTFVDPWHQEYQMALDTNYDNEIADPSSGSTGAINASILIWSLGKDGTFDPQKDPKSW